MDRHCGLLYCVCVCVCACVRACVRACVCVCTTLPIAISVRLLIVHTVLLIRLLLSNTAEFSWVLHIFVVLSTVKIRKVFTYAVQSPLCNTDSNYSTPPKSPVVSGSSGTAQESTDSRPRPPSPPPHTSPVTVGGAKPAAGSYSSPSTTHHSPQPPREDSVKC